MVELLLPNLLDVLLFEVLVATLEVEVVNFPVELDFNAKEDTSKTLEEDEMMVDLAREEVREAAALDFEVEDKVDESLEDAEVYVDDNTFDEAGIEADLDGKFLLVKEMMTDLAGDEAGIDDTIVRVEEAAANTGFEDKPIVVDTIVALGNYNGDQGQCR